MKKKEKDLVLHNYNMIITYLKNMYSQYEEKLEERHWEAERDHLEWFLSRIDLQIKSATAELTEFISIHYLNGDK
jgi:hypothetical protein